MSAVWTARDTPTWSVGVSSRVGPTVPMAERATAVTVEGHALAPEVPSEGPSEPGARPHAPTGRRVAQRRAERTRLRVRRLGGGCRLAVATGAWSIGWLVAWVLVPTVALGWTPVAITSGSMAPLIRPGDVVLLQPGGELAPGTVVTVPRGDGRVTHRLISQRDDGTWVSRGDANATADREPVHPDEVLGVGRLVVPFIGWPAATLTGVGTSSAAFSASTEASASLRTGVLEPPGAFNATCVSGSRVDLSWTPSPTSAVTRYQIERRRHGETNFTPLATIAGRTTVSYRDTSSPFAFGLLDLGTKTVTYRLRAEIGGTSWRSTSAQAGTSGLATSVLIGGLIFVCN